ncbi:RNA polymerase sigma factor (sigma-70 family) [Tahibacter aquaticus]|uniref:RNA polymerase sigma factor (Sigma-70 family) n=1 Tax=Tahibacter aquaticus TaxID=520092 RepID=A0A4R6Z524_9GAMM|nr:sigma-70 family RNA polymerase sigma factor [Tahibacter aquaticus]TDR46790.1 RNA polymerase sigma factor (sigma-70 family) [Tahibacter aquaticus]
MEGGADGREETHASAVEISESDAVARLPGVRALILRMTHDPTLTNDLTQDVLIAVMLAIREGRLRQPAALAAYMHQCARHMVYAANRKVQPIPLDTLPEQDSVGVERPRTPLELCEEDELRRIAHEVLAELPAQRDRDLLTGFYIDGVDKIDLMQRLQLTAEHFDKVIFRARTRMRDRLREKMLENRSKMRETASPTLPFNGRSRSE